MSARSPDVTLNRSERIAFLACLSLGRLQAYDLARIAASTLSASEMAYLQRAQTSRRKREIVGGRLAAKQAINRCRAELGWPKLDSPAIEVITSRIEGPVVKCADGFTAAVSISHSYSWVVAVAALPPARCTVDIEDDSTRVRCSLDYFRPQELVSMSEPVDGRKMWTLKEALAKLTFPVSGSGPLQIPVIKHSGKYFARIEVDGNHPTHSLYVGEMPPLVVSLAMANGS